MKLILLSPVSMEMCCFFPPARSKENCLNCFDEWRAINPWLLDGDEFLKILKPLSISDFYHLLYCRVAIDRIGKVVD